MNRQMRLHRTSVNPLREALLRWVSGTGHGQGLGHWLSRTIALPQLRRLTRDTIPWSPLPRPLGEATVALVTTSGVHLRDDRPFALASDPTFRVILRTAEAGDLAISHEAYDRTDALRDINLVFPLQRLRELEVEGAIGTTGSAWWVRRPSWSRRGGRSAGSSSATASTWRYSSPPDPSARGPWDCSHARWRPRA